jgi:hypothetical protein
MSDTSGFYKNDDGWVLYGFDVISNANYVLNRDLKDTYEYPLDGWYWFDTAEEAYSFFNIPYTPPVEELPINFGE